MPSPGPNHPPTGEWLIDLFPTSVFWVILKSVRGDMKNLVPGRQCLELSLGSRFRRQKRRFGKLPPIALHLKARIPQKG